MWNIEYSVIGDKEQIKELYNISFVGDEEFADWYFCNLWKADQTLVIKEDGIIVSTLQMLPLCFEKEGNQIQGCYIFAVCTHPESRGKGFAGKLIEKSFDICKIKGLEFCALIARESALLDYYGRFGFKPILKASVKNGRAKCGENTILSPDRIEEIAEIYRHKVGNMLHVERDEEYWLRQMSIYKVYGLEGKGQLDSYCFGDIRDGIFYAAEACGEHIERLVSFAAFAEGADEYKLLSIPDENAEAIGCIKPLSDKLNKMVEKERMGYLNLYFN